MLQRGASAILPLDAFRQITIPIYKVLLEEAEADGIK